MESSYNHLAFSHLLRSLHSYSVQKTVFVRFISTDDSLKALSSLGKKRKSSQGTENMTEDHAGIFIMNTLVNIEMFNYVKVIFLSDILLHSFAHQYSWRFTRRCIQTGGFGLPELGVDSTLP